MCAIAAIVVGALAAGAATVYSARKQADAQNESTKAMLNAQKEAQSQAAAPQQTATDVTSTVQSMRRRISGAQGGGSTVTGAANVYGAGGTGNSTGLLGS